MKGRLGVVVAGGKGERFGGPKALAMYRGRTLVERAREVLALACDEVVIVAPPELDLPVPAESRVADAIDGTGPLSAMVAGFESRAFAEAFVLAVDMPRIERVHVERLFAIAVAPRGPLVLVPAPGGRLQPLAAVYTRDVVPVFRAALDRGERSPTRAIEALAARTLDDAALEAHGIPPECFADVDTPEDLVRLEGRTIR